MRTGQNGKSYISGIISIKPCEDENVVPRIPPTRAPWRAPIAPASDYASAPPSATHLHLDHLHGLAEDVLASLGRPDIAMLSHRRGGSDGENNGRFRYVICRGGSCLVSIASNTHGHRTSCNGSSGSDSIITISLRGSRSRRSQEFRQHYVQHLVIMLE